MSFNKSKVKLPISMEICVDVDFQKDYTLKLFCMQSAHVLAFFFTFNGTFWLVLWWLFDNI